MNLDFLIPISFFAAAAWTVNILVEAYRARQRMRIAADFHSKLLERVNSTQEFGAFLSTTGGARFLDSLTVTHEGGPHVRILRAAQSGLMLLALGIGLFLYGSSRDIPGRADDAVFLFATVAASLGIGLLLSAGASYGLSKRMGLMNGEITGRSHSPHAA
jgi:hypothetical protein